jgi:hypothetical protein
VGRAPRALPANRPIRPPVRAVRLALGHLGYQVGMAFAHGDAQFSADLAIGHLL